MRVARGGKNENDLSIVGLRERGSLRTRAKLLKRKGSNARDSAPRSKLRSKEITRAATLRLTKKKELGIA